MQYRKRSISFMDRTIMASFAAAHRYHQLLAITIIIIALAPAVVESTRVSAAATTKLPIEIYPSCKTTLMPKRCSIKLLDLNSTLSEANALVAGLTVDEKLRNDTCITECAAVVDTAAAKVLDAVADEAALRQLKGYLEEKVINMDGPIPPCSCQCPKSCSVVQAQDVGKLVGAAEAMTAMAKLLKDLLETKRTKENEALAAASEKAIGDGSGVFHASCGTTKQTQKCADVLAAVLKTAKEAYDEALDLPKPAHTTEMNIMICTQAIGPVMDLLESAATSVRNLGEIRASIQSRFQQRPCEFSCPPPPPPPKEQCSAKEAAAVRKLNGVPDAFLILDKFLAEEI